MSTKSEQNIKILKGTVCGGEQVLPGDILEATPREKQILVGIGKAEYTDEKPKKVARPKAKAAPKAKADKQVNDGDLEKR